MSKTIDVLKKIFSDTFIESSPDFLREPSENMTRKICKGSIVDDDILLCRLDQDGIDPFPYFRGSPLDHGCRGMKRISDYVLFVDKDDKLFVLLLELKKGKESPHEQLNVTEPLIKFVFDRARILKHLDNIDFLVRKIGITDEVDKRNTSDRGEIVYDNNFVRLYRNNRIFLQKLLK